MRNEGQDLRMMARHDGGAEEVEVEMASLPMASMDVAEEAQAEWVATSM